MSVKGFTYEISQEQGVFSFSADAGENTNVWFDKYSTPSAFESEESEYGSSWSWMGQPGSISSPNSGTLNPETGSKLSVHQKPDGTSSVVHTNVTEPNPTGLTFDGQYFWVNGQSSGFVYQIKKTDGSVVNKFDGPSPNLQGITWDGNYLRITDTGANYVYQVNDTGATITKFSAPTSDPRGIAWSGSYLYLAERGNFSVKFLKTDGTEVNSFGFSHDCAGAAHDGTYIYVIAGGSTSKIYRYKKDGSKAATFNAPQTASWGGTWDGKYFFYQPNSSGVMYRITGSASLDVSYRVSSVV